MATVMLSGKLNFAGPIKRLVIYDNAARGAAQNGGSQRYRVEWMIKPSQNSA